MRGDRKRGGRCGEIVRRMGWGRNRGSREIKSLFKFVFTYKLYFSWSITQYTVLYLSTKIPACTAWTMLRNRGFSSGRRRTTPIFRVKVDASQSRTSMGTESAWISLSSSSVSSRRLKAKKKKSHFNNANVINENE